MAKLPNTPAINNKCPNSNNLNYLNTFDNPNKPNNGAPLHTATFGRG